MSSEMLHIAGRRAGEVNGIRPPRPLRHGLQYQMSQCDLKIDTLSAADFWIHIETNNSCPALLFSAHLDDVAYAPLEQSEAFDGVGQIRKVLKEQRDWADARERSAFSHPEAEAVDTRSLR